MLNSTEDRQLCLDLLKGSYFFVEEHQQLFCFLQHLSKEEKNFEDISIIIDEAKQKGVLEKFDGVSYVMELSMAAPTSVDIHSYIKSLKEAWLKREVLSASQHLEENILKTENISFFLDSFIERVKTLQSRGALAKIQRFSSVSAGEKSKSYLNTLSHRLEFFRKHNRPFVDGVSTGYEDLDQIIGGFGNSNLIILASRPGMGKTALALNFAKNISKKNKLGIVSLEMSSHQLYERFLSMEAEVPGDVIREGRMDNKQWAKVQKTEPTIATLPIFIIEGV